MPNKRVSFHVGVKVYDPQVYHEAPDLLSSADDARQMYNLAGALGYTGFDLKPRGKWQGADAAPPEVLIDQAAKYADVVGLFDDAAALLQDEGDACFITFSGHGTQFKKDPPLPDPEGKFNEAVCVFDFPLVDDVIVGLLGAFKKGVDVFIVLDCCHAGATSLHKGAILQDDKIALLPVMLPKQQPPQHGTKEAAAPLDPPPPLHNELFEKFKGFDRTKIAANVAAFEACRDNKSTFDGKNPGELSLYTAKFVNAIGDGSTTVADVAAAIQAMPDEEDCEPQFQHTQDVTFLNKPMSA